VGSTAADLLDQPLDQRHVPVLADLAAQPQAGTDHHGQRHPHAATLFLHTDRIGLHLPQVAWLFDHIGVHNLALLARSRPPGGHGALVEPQGRTDRWQRTAMGEPRHDKGNRLRRGA
jgi:hypothetical protein